MKNIALGISVLLMAYGLFWTSTKKDSLSNAEKKKLTSPNKENLKKPFENIGASAPLKKSPNLNPNTSKSHPIMNASEEELMNKWDDASRFERIDSVKKLVGQLASCLSNSTCLPEKDQGVYHDENNSYKHRLLVKGLDVLRYQVDNDDWTREDIFRAITIPNHEVSISAILLVMSKGTKEDIKKLFNVSTELKGETAAEFFNLISKGWLEDNPEFREDRNLALQSVVKKSEFDTLFHLAKKLPSYDLEESTEVTSILKSTCDKKAIAPDSGAWKQIEYRLEKFAKQKGTSYKKACL